jgi:malate synthase
MAPTGIHLTIPVPKGGEEIITDDALTFLASLHRTFNEKRLQLLENRKIVQAELDKVSKTIPGELGFDKRTASTRLRTSSRQPTMGCEY